jgi:hypothetical protein
MIERFKLGDRHKGERAIMVELQATWSFTFWVTLSARRYSHIIGGFLSQDSGDHMI